MEFNEENINDLIRHWRKKKAKAELEGNTASCYVDAYQTTTTINTGG